MVAVRDADLGWQNLMKVFRSPKCELLVSVGVPYASYVEFGTSRMPARPFLRWTFDEHTNYRWQIKRLANAMIRGSMRGAGGRFMSPAQAMSDLGEKIVKDIRRTVIGMGIWRTGALHDSVQAEVFTGGSL